jgi:hypothetical protein
VEAFEDPASGRLTVVGENNSATAQPLTLSLNNLSAVPNSLQYYQTNSDSDLAPGADVAVNGASATVTVPGSTTFTLTGLGGVADTVPPTAPTNVVVTGGIGTANLSWSTSTDNVGVTGYDVYRSTAAGFTPSAANKVGQTAATSFTDNGLSAGTYYYLVAARDAAGNVSDPSNEAHATVAGDTTAPTVSISSPTAGATLSGTVSVTASAGDNVGITGVQFELDGSNLGAGVTAAPYSTSWDTTKTNSGSHTLAAVARDAAGNTTTSIAVTVTVSNLSSDGLLLGSATVQSSADSDAAGEAEAFKFTATASGTAGTLAFYVDSGSAANALAVGVYSDASGQPGALLTSGSINSPKLGAWNAVKLNSNPTLTSGSPYWIALLGIGGQLNYRDDAGGNCSQSNATAGLTSLPATWASGIGWPSCNLSAYVSSPAPAGTTSPSITAIYFDSPGSDTGSNKSLNAEWVRIKNIAHHRKALTGWTLRNASGHRYRFQTFHLAAGAAVKVHTGRGTNTAANLYWRADKYIWNNGGDTATLKDANGNRIDTCHYTSADDPEAFC